MTESSLPVVDVRFEGFDESRRLHRRQLDLIVLEKLKHFVGCPNKELEEEWIILDNFESHKRTVDNFKSLQDTLCHLLESEMSFVFVGTDV